MLTLSAETAPASSPLLLVRWEDVQNVISYSHFQKKKKSGVCSGALSVPVCSVNKGGSAPHGWSDSHRVPLVTYIKTWAICSFKKTTSGLSGLESDATELPPTPGICDALSCPNTLKANSSAFQHPPLCLLQRRPHPIALILYGFQFLKTSFFFKKIYIYCIVCILNNLPALQEWQLITFCTNALWPRLFLCKQKLGQTTCVTVALRKEPEYLQP